MRDGVHPPRDGVTPYERHPPLADWSVAASHLLGSAALGDNGPMLDGVWDGCALAKVDLTGLWSDLPAPDAGTRSCGSPEAGSVPITKS